MVKFVSEIVLKFLFAQRAETLTAKFIWYMPHYKSRMVAYSVDYLIYNDTGFFSEFRWWHTVIMSETVVCTVVIGIYTHTFRIFFVKPGRAGTWRCCKNGIDAIFIEFIHNVFEPVHMKLALWRFICCPCEYAYGHTCHLCFFHKFNIFFKNVGAVKPLVRVVVWAVEQSLYLRK